MLKFEILIVNLVQIFYNLEANGFKSHSGEYKLRGGGQGPGHAPAGIHFASEL